MLTLLDTTVHNNVATSASPGGGGGGIKNLGVLNVAQSTIAANSTNAGGGGIVSSGPMTAANSTISGNTAGGGGGGGLLTAATAATATLVNVTVTENSTTSTGGGFRALLAPVEMLNTIVAANSAAGGSPDCAAFSTTAPVSRGHNLIGNDSGCLFTPLGTDLVGSAAEPIDPLLGPLQNNGGPTMTHALMASSPAIDAGDGAVTLPPLNLTTDQRGGLRLVGTFVDIGAYEAGNVVDDTPPVVTPPESLTVETDSPDGVGADHPAIVAFLAAATAEDDVDGMLPVSDDAPSVFGVGATEVTFSATDEAGNTGIAVATVTVTLAAVTAEDAILALLSTITELDLNRGTENALVSKLRRALSALERGQDRAARNVLSALLNQIRALEGKKLDSETAAELSEAVLAIIDSI